jgi:hypothetical protein
MTWQRCCFVEHKKDLERCIVRVAADDRLAELTRDPELLDARIRQAGSQAFVDDLGMRKLPASAAEDLLEIVMRRYERASTILTSNRPLDDWPKLFGDTPAVAAFLDRLMHHSHLIEIRGKSYRLHEHSLVTRGRKAKASA